MTLLGWDYNSIVSCNIWQDEDYLCDICAKTFRSSRMLSKHYKVHADASSYVCELCMHPFPRRDTLIAHLRRMHPGNHSAKLEAASAEKDEEKRSGTDSAFACLQCSRSFSSRLSLGRHTKMLHAATVPVSKGRVSQFLQFSRGFNLFEDRPAGEANKEVYLIQPALPEDRRKLLRDKVAPRYFCYMCPAKFRNLILFTCHSKVIHGRSGLIVYDMY